jgi:hypothetical protein
VTLSDFFFSMYGKGRLMGYRAESPVWIYRERSPLVDQSSEVPLNKNITIPYSPRECLF